jgi:hypothetical protein
MKSIGVVAETGVHLFGQGFYFLMQGVAWVFRNRRFFDETRAVRRAAHFYWSSRARTRHNEPTKALEEARQAFEALNEADPAETFPQMGLLIVSQLDSTSRANGNPESVANELSSALNVFRRLHVSGGGKWTDPTRIIPWLESRLHR